MKAVFVLLVFLAGAGCRAYADDIRQMAERMMQSKVDLVLGRRLKQKSQKFSLEANKSRSKFDNDLKQILDAIQISHDSKKSSGENRRLVKKRAQAKKKRASKGKHRSMTRKHNNKVRKAKRLAHKKGKHARKMSDARKAISLDEILRIVPESLGIKGQTPEQNFLSAAGTTALGYGAYNYLSRKQDFEVYGKKLVGNYNHRERILSLMNNQINELQEISMGLNICKNRVKRIGSLFSDSVLNKIKPSSQPF
jgi:hypothetical protein